MMYDRDSCRLQRDEIVALMVLAGCRNFVGFPVTEDLLTKECLWDAYCRLSKDDLLRQEGGQVRLSRELMDVIRPIVEAQRVWVVTPTDEQYPQVLYYVGKDAVAVTMSDLGALTLTPMHPTEIAVSIEECAPIEYSEQDMPFEVSQSTIPFSAELSVLQQSAELVLECLDAENAERLAWVRVKQEGLGVVAEWCRGGETSSCVYSEGCLANIILGEMREEEELR